MTRQNLAKQAAPFLEYLEGWMSALPVITMRQAAPQASRAAILSVDITNGFCYEGNLSSPRVAGLVEPITRLFTQALEYGIRSIALSQDTHEPDAVEFAQFPPHCVRGSSEAQTVDAIKALPFYAQMAILEKNSVEPGFNTGLDAWLEEHADADTFIVVGDCTDLCTYQLAMHIKLNANAHQLQRRVIVPANCVQTYDRPIEAAQAQGGLPHPGDLMHAIFLYHMQLNGIEVVAEIRS